MKNADGWVTIGIDMDTKNFEAEIQATEKKLNDLISDYETMSKEKGFKEQSHEAVELRKEIEKTNNKLLDLNRRQAEINKQGFNVAAATLEETSNKLSDIIGKVTKYALAVVGVRSAYMGIRRAISLVSSQNQEIASQFDVMKATVAQALLPVVQKIVEWLSLAMIYINNIIYGITGKYVFDFEKAFASVEKSAKKTSGYAKEIRKTLFGFDEMNILNENVSGGVGPGGLSNIQLTNPFENWQDLEMPEWVDKVIEFGKWVLENWVGVVETLLLFKMVIDILTGNWVQLAIDGIGFLITFILDLSGKIGGLSKELNGVEGETKNVKIATEKLVEEQKNLQQAIENTQRASSKYVSAVDREEDALKRLQKAQKDNGITVEEVLKTMKEQNLNYKDLPTPMRNVYKAYLEHEQATSDLNDALKDLEKAQFDENAQNIATKISSDDVTFAKMRETMAYKDYQDAVVEAYKKGEISAAQAKNYIEQGMSDISKASAETFKKDLPDAIKEGLDVNRYRTIFSNFENKWQSFIKGLSAVIPIKFTTSGNSYTAPTGRHAYTGAVVKLAPGGIVNLPGRGVPVGNAITGERGMEGVIPLTNQQMMEQLGQTIAKYISFNATIPVSIGNRLVAKEIKKINAENDFAYNR